MAVPRHKYRRNRNVRTSRGKMYDNRKMILSKAVNQYYKKNVHWFKRKFQMSVNQLVQGTTDNFASMFFTLSNINTPGTLFSASSYALPNYTEFTNLYDCYRILGVKVNFIPRHIDTNTPSYASGNGSALLWYSIDTNDGAVPSSLQTLAEYNTSKCRYMYKPFSIFLTPKSVNQVYESAITNAYEAKGKRWIDTGDPDVPHYGIKLGVPASTASTGFFKMDVTVTYYIQCKQSK